MDLKLEKVIKDTFGPKRKNSKSVFKRLDETVTAIRTRDLEEGWVMMVAGSIGLGVVTYNKVPTLVGFNCWEMDNKIFTVTSAVVLSTKKKDFARTIRRFIGHMWILPRTYTLTKKEVYEGALPILKEHCMKPNAQELMEDQTLVPIPQCFGEALPFNLGTFETPFSFDEEPFVTGTYFDSPDDVAAFMIKQELDRRLEASVFEKCKAMVLGYKSSEVTKLVEAWKQ